MRAPRVVSGKFRRARFQSEPRGDRIVHYVHDLHIVHVFCSPLASAEKPSE